MTSTAIASTTSYQLLDLKQISKHPKNPRHKAVADPELVESVRVSGLVQPIVVAPVTDEAGNITTYLLIAGHRRIDALKKAKRPTAPAIVRSDLVTEGQQLEAMIIENGHREDLTPIEEAEGYHQLELIGYKQVAIAKAVGRDVKTIRTRLKLLKLSASTKKKVHAGDLTLDDASAMVEFADDPVASHRLESAAKAGSLYSFKQEIHAARRRRDNNRNAAVERAKLLDHGAKAVDLGDHDWWESRNAVRGPIELNSTHSADWGQHKTCLGYVDTTSDYHGDQIRIVCTDPAAHETQLTAAALNKHKEEAKAQEEAAAQRAVETDAAGARTDTILELVTGAVLPDCLADVVRGLLPALVVGLDPVTGGRYMEILHIPEPDRWRAGYLGNYSKPTVDDTLFAQHVDDIATWPAPKITRALVAALICEAEHVTVQAWSRKKAPAAAYLDLLDAIGYQAGPVEKRIRAELPGTTERAAS